MHFKWIICIFWVWDIIASTWIIVCPMHVLEWIFTAFFLEICHHLSVRLLREYFMLLFFVLLWWILDIIYAIFFSVEIEAKKTMIAARTGIAKCNFWTILTISGKEYRITSRTVETLITIIWLKHYPRIKTIITVSRIAEIITILEIINIKTKIAVFQISCTIIIVWIF